MDVAVRASLCWPPPLIASHRHRGRGRTVVAPVAGHYLVPPRHHPRDPDGSLVGLGARRREQEVVDVSRYDLREQFRKPRAHWGLESAIRKATIESAALDVRNKTSKHRRRHTRKQ